MTIVVTLSEPSEPPPQSPSFLHPSPSPEQDLGRVIKAILSSKGLVVVMGELYIRVSVFGHANTQSYRRRRIRRCWNPRFQIPDGALPYSQVGVQGNILGERSL